MGFPVRRRLLGDKVSDWDSVTTDELRAAAKVARASGGVVMSGAAAAWELRADLMEEMNV